MSEIWIAAIGGGLGATIVGVLNALFGRRKLSADATRVIEESASSAVQRGEAEIGRLLTRVEKLEGTVESLLSTTGTLRDELRGRDHRIDELSNELVAFREYSIQLRDALQAQDPTLRLPEPPPRIARHFLSP